MELRFLWRSIEWWSKTIGADLNVLSCADSGCIACRVGCSGDQMVHRSWIYWLIWKSFAGRKVKTSRARIDTSPKSVAASAPLSRRASMLEFDVNVAIKTALKPSLKSKRGRLAPSWTSIMSAAKRQRTRSAGPLRIVSAITGRDAAVAFSNAAFAPQQFPI
jgi:hypothetical protein